MRKEQVGVGREENLDLHLYLCEDCGNKWYDAADVIALVVSYGTLVAKPTTAGGETNVKT
jgi:hypothetical protein